MGVPVSLGSLLLDDACFSVCFGTYLAVLRLQGIKAGVAVYKANALPIVRLLWPLVTISGGFS